MDRVQIAVVAAESAAFAVAVPVFWLFVSGADAMGYWLLFVWGLMPAVSFATSFCVGVRGIWGRRGAAWPALCGALVALLPFATFDAAYVLNAGRPPLPDSSTLALGLAASYVGYGLGAAARAIRKRADRRRRMAASPGEDGASFS